MARISLDGPYLQRVGIDTQTDLAPLTRLGRPVFLGKPLALTFGLDPGAIDQQMQGTGALTIGNGDVQALLAARQRAEVRHRPIESGQFQQACNQPGRLPQRQAEPSRGFARSGLKSAHWTDFLAPFTLQRQARPDRFLILLTR